MKAAIDEILVDDEIFELEIKSQQRKVVQRSSMGLDGQISIDLGLRGRKLIQKGELKAKSKAELQKRINEINEMIDGELHSLKCPDGRIFNNLLIDEFLTGTIVNSGAHQSCNYQIVYIQQG
ncbi:MAG: hypothetical protein A2Y10_02840 [Planctomycetes bacterium GWF2_41_51]|nr:MAG: hypothetical protein A2Y10_02840 [Planctomycetes bacterium GWF2_41_51]HBG27487.1 hypothetical protein [Phycisphaerales bacterium]